jgi:hypothetical protein
MKNIKLFEDFNFSQDDDEENDRYIITSKVTPDRLTLMG